VATTHAQTGTVTVNVTSSGLNGGGDFVATFNVKVDGVNSDSFEPYAVYLHFDNAAQAVPDGKAAPNITDGQRNQLFGYNRNTHELSVSIASVVSTGNGNYQVTVPAANVIDNSNLLTIVKAPGSAAATSYIGTWELEGTANIQLGTAHLRDLVTNTGCASCHGPYPAWSEKFQHYAVGGSECQICHSIVDRNIGIISLLDNGSRVESQQKAGTNLPEYIHGIHNSHNMPAGSYFRSLTGSGPEQVYSIGYPSDMRNCKVCHTTDDQRTAAATAPPSFYLCMSCHQNWDGFGASVAVGGSVSSFHRSLGMSANCMLCHDGSASQKKTAADFHNFFEAGDSHLNSFYNGTDISYDNPDNVTFGISSITKSGDNVTFTWTATKNGLAVNPCNDNLANGPVFGGSGGIGAYLAYAKGDDWVNENVSATQAPGQPQGSRPLFPSATSTNHLSTTCADNVATSTGLVVATGAKAYAQKATLAIGGKAKNRGTFIIQGASTSRDYFVRVPSPTKVFSMTDGSLLTARRSAVDTLKCNTCHRGTLYQHGGDRVDNEQLCVICHNPSSSEKNVRVGYGILNADNTVNTSATYDGKSAETYDMRYLIHAIHGAEKRDKPLVIYRGRGIYAFATGSAVMPTGWPAPGDNTIYGSTTGATQTHTWTVVHYPKPISECTACHTAGLYEVPDQKKAVAVTVEPGTSWPSQTDDVSIGPAAAACTACHATAVVRSHAQNEGYLANVIKEDMVEMAQDDFFWVTP
jgi:OmcA/MtrC family decaheme c-type cytochrome